MSDIDNEMDTRVEVGCFLQLQISININLVQTQLYAEKLFLDHLRLSKPVTLETCVNSYFSFKHRYIISSLSDTEEFGLYVYSVYIFTLFYQLRIGRNCKELKSKPGYQMNSLKQEVNQNEKIKANKYLCDYDDLFVCIRSPSEHEQ